MTTDDDLVTLAQYLAGEPSALEAVQRVRAELDRLHFGQFSAELAISRAVTEIDEAFTWLEKFVDLAGGEVVCGAWSTAVGGGESNNPWANALEVLTEQGAENTKLRTAIQDAGFGLMQTSGKWSIHDVSEKAKQHEADDLKRVNRLVDLEIENERLKSRAIGTPLWFIDELFTFAGRECGHNPHSARHALTTVAEWVAAAKAENERLREALEPFRHGHLYADDELRHLPDLDTRNLNTHDHRSGPTFGDCRRAADLLAELESKATAG